MSGPAPTRRRGWLRRNLLPLIVLVVAIPALAFVLVGLPLIDIQGREGNVQHIAQGESGEADGYRFTLTQSKEFPGTGTDDDGNAIPVGLSLVGVIIEVEPLDGASEDGSCDAELVAGEGDEQRIWSEVNSPLDFQYGVSEDSETVCLFEGEPFAYEIVFLTPGGAYDDASLKLSGIDADEQYYEFRFDLVR